jgi:hypothetical protein
MGWNMRHKALKQIQRQAQEEGSGMTDDAAADRLTSDVDDPVGRDHRLPWRAHGPVLEVPRGIEGLAAIYRDHAIQGARLWLDTHNVQVNDDHISIAS